MASGLGAEWAVENRSRKKKERVGRYCGGTVTNSHFISYFDPKQLYLDNKCVSRIINEEGTEFRQKIENTETINGCC
uniref:Uncharacterized protein n=1 Tax=Salix viminalis TaxID=40686 RepID=A0A6N2N5Q2_SALVM